MLAKSRYLVFTLDFLLPMFTLLGIAGGMWVLLYSPLLAISEIICTADYQPCTNAAVIAEIDKVRGSNIFRYNDSSLKAKLLSGDYMAQEISTTKILPNKLMVELSSINPSFALQLEGGNTWIVCDATGKVIGERAVDPNVPVIITSHLPAIKVGSLLPDEELLHTGQMALSLRDANITFKQITLKPDSILELSLTSGLLVIMTTAVPDLTPQITALQQTLTDSTIKKEGYDSLDVRFAQPILKQN